MRTIDLGLISRNSTLQAKNLLVRLPGSDQAAAGSDQDHKRSRSVRLRAELAFVTRVRLFVYGSLRRGQQHHAELHGADFLGASVTRASYRIVELEGYPCLVAGKSSVAGELYSVPPELLARLDAFEGQNYRRGLVELADGSRAEVYVAAKDSLP
jgi:gamma-glutamylcyclotransferase (GGCT)/AIG2-like uncharacterized protein YtfP